MIYFKNEGLIDVRAMTTFGVSVKEGDNPIGFFGTGLKYAVAIILRLGGSVTVWRGKREYTFNVKQTSIRGEQFNIVCLGNKELGFTTDVGKTWEAWQAFRELACNTTDEGGTITNEPTAPKTGMTLIVIDCKAIDHAYTHKDELFLPTTPNLVESFIEIHDKTSDHIYYRGIRVGTFDQPTINTYNITDHVDLTEDRTIKHPFQVERAVRLSVVQSNDTTHIENFVTAPMKTMEQQIDLDYADIPSDAFMSVMRELSFSDVTNLSAKELFRKQSRSKYGPLVADMTDIEKTQLQKARDFCRGMNYDVTAEVIVTDDLPDTTLGTVYQKKIYLARRVFMMGTKMVAATLLEEHIHIVKGLRDETYAMQNFLFELVVSLGEQLQGEPL